MKNNYNEIKIKRCPYCGGRAYISETMDQMYIQCEHTEECGIRPSGWLNSNKPLEQQIRDWNMRFENK
jgi:hypothetical protein